MGGCFNDVSRHSPRNIPIVAACRASPNADYHPSTTPPGPASRSILCHGHNVLTTQFVEATGHRCFLSPPFLLFQLEHDLLMIMTADPNCGLYTASLH